MKILNIDRRQEPQKNIVTIEFTTLGLSKYQISSKLENLAFLVQNCDLKDDRCQYQQVSILAGVKYRKNFVTIEFRVFDFDLSLRVSNFIKIEALATLALNYCHH